MNLQNRILPTIRADKEKAKELTELSKDGKITQISLRKKEPFIRLGGKKESINRVIAVLLKGNNENYFIAQDGNTLENFSQMVSAVEDDSLDVFLAPNDINGGHLPKFKLYLSNENTFIFYPEQEQISITDFLMLCLTTRDYTALVILNYSENHTPQVLVHIAESTEAAIMYQYVAECMVKIALNHELNLSSLQEAKDE